jgi:CRP-like cAMP-binding protein
MSLDRDITLLSHIPLFSDLNTEQLRLLAFSAVRLELSPAQVLFREGAKAMSGYIVAAGTIELSVRKERGEKRDVAAVCGTGCLIGEIALFVETRRPATAIATIPSEVLEIERKLILRMLNEYPHVALRLRSTLADRLAVTIGELGKVRTALGDIAAGPARR